MIPVWQMMLGVCVGLVALILTRPQALNYHQEERRPPIAAQGGGARKPKFNSKPGDPCVICLMEMKNENMTYLPCGHALHDRCYKECKQHSKFCPICRERM